jgi:hypothetical protein
MNVLLLIKLLKDYLPDDVYRRIVELILQLMENEDRLAYSIMRQKLLDWVRENYPELEKLMEKILNLIRPSTAAEEAGFFTWEVAGVFGLALLPILSLVGFGLALPASKLGTLGITDKSVWQAWYDAWFADPCDKLYREITDAYADHVSERGLFPQGFTHRSPAVGNLMSDAGHVITLCARFLRDCPKHKMRPLVQDIYDKMSAFQQEYWSF